MAVPYLTLPRGLGVQHYSVPGVGGQLGIAYWQERYSRLSLPQVPSRSCCLGLKKRSWSCLSAQGWGLSVKGTPGQCEARQSSIWLPSGLNMRILAPGFMGGPGQEIACFFFFFSF